MTEFVQAALLSQWNQQGNTSARSDRGRHDARATEEGANDGRDPLVQQLLGTIRHAQQTAGRAFANGVGAIGSDGQIPVVNPSVGNYEFERTAGLPIGQQHALAELLADPLVRPGKRQQQAQPGRPRANARALDGLNVPPDGGYRSEYAIGNAVAIGLHRLGGFLSPAEALIPARPTEEQSLAQPPSPHGLTQTRQLLFFYLSVPSHGRQPLGRLGLEAKRGLRGQQTAVLGRGLVVVLAAEKRVADQQSGVGQVAARGKPALQGQGRVDGFGKVP